MFTGLGDVRMLFLGALLLHHYYGRATAAILAEVKKSFKE